MYSCGSMNNDEEWIHHSSHTVKIIQDSIILQDSFTCFRIVSNDNSLKIISAYVDCGIKKRRELDSINTGIKDCFKRLLVENDTVKIYVKYLNTGDFKFDDITLLLNDEYNKKSFIDTTFNFRVRPSHFPPLKVE